VNRPLIESPPEWPVYSATALERVADLVRTGMVFDYAGSGAVVELEKAFSARHEGRYALSFNSGTSALFAAYSALGINTGDDVLVPNFTFLATVSPLLWLGSRPVLCDSGGEEAGVTVDTISRALTPNTKAVVVTHLFGNPVDMLHIRQFTRDEGLLLIEDCSHAHASTIDGRPVGVFGDAAIFSTGARKMVSGGHGGMLVVPDSDVRDTALLVGHFKPRARSDVRNPGLRAHAEFGLGGNLRMSPFAAVLALDHFSRLDELRKAKLGNVAVLNEALDGRLVPLRSPAGRENGTFFDIVYRLPQDVPKSARDRVVTALKAAGAPARAPATRPLNRVLGAMARSSMDRVGVLWERLASLAQQAPDDARLPNSTNQHDRMISLSSSVFHEPDLRHARAIAQVIALVDWDRVWTER